jgi:6-phosphogluconolactonase
MTELIVVARPAELAQPAAEWLEHEVSRAIAGQGRCALALSGGRTPEPAYRELALATNIDWAQVEIFFADERAVPPDHADSNYRMVDLALLSRVPIPESQVYRMEAERSDRDAAAREYQKLLPRALDILLLGVGPDGHTASLFPGSPALDERQRLVLPVIGAKPPAERMTITPPVIEAARKIVVLASGPDKAAVVARALEGPLAAKAVPAQLARRGTWLLDQAAAAQLTAPRITA